MVFTRKNRGGSAQHAPRATRTTPTRSSHGMGRGEEEVSFSSKLEGEGRRREEEGGGGRNNAVDVFPEREVLELV